MPRAQYAAETQWLQDVVRLRDADVFFSTKAERAMRAADVWRPEVLALLAANAVTFAEKSEVGWRWIVEGHDCDERRLIVELEVESTVIRIEVLDVRR